LKQVKLNLSHQRCPVGWSVKWWELARVIWSCATKKRKDALIWASFFWIEGLKRREWIYKKKCSLLREDLKEVHQDITMLTGNKWAKAWQVGKR